MPAGVLTDSFEQVMADMLLPGFKLAPGVAHVLHSLRKANLFQIPLCGRRPVVRVPKSDMLEKEAEQCLTIPGEHVECLKVGKVWNFSGMSDGELSDASDGNGA